MNKFKRILLIANVIVVVSFAIDQVKQIEASNYAKAKVIELETKEIYKNLDRVTQKSE